jgi:hypothetical protein
MEAFLVVVTTVATVMSTVLAVIQLRLHMKYQPSAVGSGQSPLEQQRAQQPAPTGVKRVWHVIAPWVFGTWQLIWLLIVFSIAVDPEGYKGLGPGFTGDLILFAVVLALNGLGAVLGYLFSRRPGQLRSATKRGWVYLGMAVLNFLLMIDLLVLLTSETTDEGSNPAASPEELADALLVPADLGDLGRMVGGDQQIGTGAGVTTSGLTHWITYVSGDAACKAVVEAHPVVPVAWAYVSMADNSDPAKASVLVEEQIEAFVSEAQARQVMEQTRDQVVDCRSFVGATEFPDGTSLRMTYKHRKISVPLFGDETVAHQLDGEAKDGTFIVWNSVQIRSGSDVLFIDYSPAEQGMAHTEKVATAAWSKYSSVR